MHLKIGMRKISVIRFAIAASIFALIFVVAAAYRQFRGATPALLPATGDISGKIASSLASSPSADFPLSVPPGFSIGVFAKGLGSPRVLAFDSVGRLLVSVPKDGKIISLFDSNHDGSADEKRVVAEGLDSPHGIVFQNPWRLFVAETDKIVSFDYAPKTGLAFGKEKVTSLPGGGNHFTRTIVFLPPEKGESFSRKLLVSVGSSCNVCREEDSRRAAILLVDVEKKTVSPYAAGLRNAVFMRVHGGTGKIWATEMGRDMLGDDLPPDEINIIEEGKNYGWPICYGKNVHDTEFDRNIYARAPCREPFETGSFADLPAHSAPLGLTFVPDGSWPAEYRNQLLAAYHGSWNRSVPTGYRIVRVKVSPTGEYEGKTATSSPMIVDFISGWLTADNRALGRPVDLLFGSDGALYISDDKAGLIYRITHEKQTPITGRREGAGVAVRPENLRPGQIVKNPLRVRGKARGWWYFEADFPVRVTDLDGRELGAGVARAEGDWMTEDYVSFSAEVKFVSTTSTEGFVEFERNNPSGLPENAQKLRIGVRFR